MVSRTKNFYRLQRALEMSSSIRVIKPPTSEIFKNEFQNIRKVTVGEIDPEVPFSHGKVLMLLGATGAGKSTLINGLVNYIRGVAYEHNYRYMLVGDEGAQSQAHSQTKWITAYTFQKNERLPYTLTIIDTPGYGDTQGIERDKQITRQIKEFFSIKGEQGIDHIDGIGFVVQASQARLTYTQRYIFDSILSMFGKDISKNIFVMVTFADGKTPPVLEAIRFSGFESQKCFKFNNSALFPDAKRGEDDDDAFNEMFWKMGEKSFANLFKMVHGTQSVSLQLTKEVLLERENLQCLIQGLQVEIKTCLSKVDQLHQEESMLQEHEKDMEANKYFTYKIDEIRQKKVNLIPGQHVTNCLKCHFTCHHPCHIPQDQQKTKCAAMNSSGNCNVCPMNCHWSKHVNNVYWFDQYTVKVTKTSDDTRKRYVNAKSKKSKKEQIMNGLSSELQKMYDVIYYKIYQLRTSIERLEEIALRPNLLTEVQYIDILIQSEERGGKDGWTRRVETFKTIRKQATMVSNISDKASYLEKCKGADKQSWEMLFRVDMD